MMPNEPTQDTAKRDDQAYALMQSAIALVPEGRWKDAADALERAAGLHGQAGRTYDEARCLQLAATLRRSAGDTDRARLLTERAAAVAPPDLPLAVSINAEQAETAFANGQHQEAVSAWTAAINAARKGRLKADGMSALLRRRAASWMALDQAERAAHDFDEAYGLLDAAHGNDLALFVRIEQAGLLLQHGKWAEAEQIVAAIDLDLRGGPPNPHLQAEMLVLRARLARVKGRLDEAGESARNARDAALQAIAPLSYFAASVELAEAQQAKGDYPGAYGALATAWATLSDVLGKETAQSWVEPCLIAFKLSWGDSEFQKAKAEYESQRRAETKRPR